MGFARIDFRVGRVSAVALSWGCLYAGIDLHKGTVALETRSLLYFIAVAEEKNIGRAAARLHISQPALTRQIQSLEDEIGVPLFTRKGPGMAITPPGMALLEHARTIRTELAQAKTTVQHANSQQFHWLDVGVCGVAICTLMPQILARFSEAYPNIELRLHSANKEQLVEFLQQGRVQIIFDRYLPQEPGMTVEPALRECLTHVAMHKDHPRAAQDSIKMVDLAEEPHIGPNTDRSIAEGLTKLSGFQPKVDHRADDMLSVLELVGSGLGVSFVPPSVLTLQIPNVVYRPLTEKQATPFDLQCMYRNNDQSSVLLAMLETVRAFRAASEGL